MEPAHNTVLGFTAKRSLINQEDKGFLGRQFKPVGSMAWQCAKRKLLSSFSHLFFFENKLFLNWVSVDVRTRLCQAGRILKTL